MATLEMLKPNGCAVHLRYVFVLPRRTRAALSEVSICRSASLLRATPRKPQAPQKRPGEPQKVSKRQQFPHAAHKASSYSLVVLQEMLAFLDEICKEVGGVKEARLEEQVQQARRAAEQQQQERIRRERRDRTKPGKE